MECRRQLIGVCAALALGACTPVPPDVLPPEVARAVATRVASSTAERMLVVLDAVGDSTMPFATHQGLTTAGFVVRDSAVLADSAFTVLHFDLVAGRDSTWVVRTHRSAAAEAREDDGGEGVEWRVQCTGDTCTIADSAAAP